MPWGVKNNNNNDQESQKKITVDTQCILIALYHTF